MKLKNIKLAKHTRGEEWLNSLTHGGGVLFGIAAAILCLQKAVKIGGGINIFASVIYGLSMIILYTSSTVYHSFPKGDVKKILRIIDHSMIYVLIAGTITPIALVTLMPESAWRAWLLLFFAWGGLLVGVSSAVFSFEKTKGLRMTLYIGIGWISLIAVRPLIKVFPTKGFLLILIGGVVYTLGTIFYGVGKKIRYMHTVFHIFVLVASLLHFIAIFKYVFI